jgi:predicted dehydrogenase
MTDQRIRVGVAGAGAIGTLHAQAVAQSADAELAAICDTDQRRAIALATRYSVAAFPTLDELLARKPLDVLTVATPDDQHVEITLRALQAGIDVFCEKPLATDLLSAQRMVQVAAEQGRQLAVNYNRRYGFAYQQAWSWLQAGRIGRPFHLGLSVTDRRPDRAAERDATFMLSSLLTHHFDLIRWLGGEIVQVQSKLDRMAGSTIIDRALFSLRLAGDLTATITAFYRDRQPRTQESMEILGSEGRIQVEDVTREARLVDVTGDRIEIGHPDPFHAGDAFYATITSHLHDFMRRRARGEPAPVTGRDGVRGLMIVAAAIQSHNSLQPVEVPS